MPGTDQSGSTFALKFSFEPALVLPRGRSCAGSVHEIRARFVVSARVSEISLYQRNSPQSHPPVHAAAFEISSGAVSPGDC